MGGVEAGRQALADDSMPGTAPGSGGRSGKLWRESGGPAKGFQAGATGRGRREAVVSWDGVEWSRSGSQTRSGGGSATKEYGMTASGRGSRLDSFERQEGFVLPGESVRLRRPVRSRGVAGAPAERGEPHAVGAWGKSFPQRNSKVRVDKPRVSFSITEENFPLFLFGKAH